MTATVQLFPTFTNLFQRAKLLLATDTRDFLQRFLKACEADEERYQRELEAKGMEDFNPLGNPFI